METAMERCMRESEAEQMTTNKKKVDSFALLPDDLLLDILQRLPRYILRYRTRFICKRWFILTTNWIILDHDSVLVQSFHESRKVRLMDTSEEKQGLKMKERDLEIPHSTGRIKSWCNEFLLIRGFADTFYIYNLVTRQVSYLPPCSTSCQGYPIYTFGAGLSYDKFKGVYKVVHVFLGQEIQCEILILKNRSSITSCIYLKWKKIRIPRYTDYDTFYWGEPVSVQGRYFHWDVKNHKYLVSMDTVKEKFRQTLLPGSDLFSRHTRYFIVEMGGFLTLFINEESDDKIKIWMLKDYQSSNWENLISITISSDVWSSIYISTRLSYPVIWVINKRFIIFQKLTSAGYDLYSYDLKTKMERRLEFDFASNKRFVVQTTSCMLSESPKRQSWSSRLSHLLRIRKGRLVSGC